MSEPDPLHTHARQLAEQLHQDIRGATSVLIATADGFELAQAGATEDASRLAAMASAIAAIGQVVSQETALGEPHCMVLDAARGFLLLRTVQRAGSAVVISVLTSREALLGMAMHAVNQAARRFEAS